eukprot:354517-Chlamydomonas_euryale.AAC.1
MPARLQSFAPDLPHLHRAAACARAPNSCTPTTHDHTVPFAHACQSRASFSLHVMNGEYRHRIA